MEDSNLQSMIREVATQVYNELGTRFGVAKVPAHTHNGVDSNQIPYKNIVQGNKYITNLVTEVADIPTVTFTIGGISNPTRIVFQGFAANNSITAYTTTAGMSGGDTSATLSTNWTRTTGVYPVTFSNGDIRYVTLTNGATTATWTGGLSGAATSSISVGANKRAIINGEINFGTCFAFTDLTPPIVVSTSGSGVPYTQSYSFMFTDTAALDNTRVGAAGGAGSTANAFFAYAVDSTPAVFASATVDSYNNQLGLLTITIVLGTNVKLQGAFTIT